jgi:carboxyl-terminal processing protease
VTIDGPAAKKQNLVDRDGAIHFKGPLVMLTSRSSASGSEILVGALKDYRRAVVVGDDRTFGKGTVQNILDLPTGLGALKVTTSYFYLPGGRTTQKEGVSSHIVVPTILNGGDHGEARKPYVLSGDRIAPFMSGVENVADPARRWQPITDAQITRLAALSKKRVSASSEFRELEEERARRIANEGKVSIEKILSKSDGEAEKDEDDDDKDELTIQAKEALAILADLVELSD